MELRALTSICNGLAALSDLERQHPILGEQLAAFVTTVKECCQKAYVRFSSSLDTVLSLPANPAPEEKVRVLAVLDSASSSEWFRNVARICDDLAALANTHDAALQQQVDFADARGTGEGQSIQWLLEVLHQHEGDLKQDIRDTVDRLRVLLADGAIVAARELAMRTKAEIEQSLTQIHVVTTRIVGSRRHGAETFLQSAARPELSTQRAAAKRTIVILMHGIRTSAAWQRRVASTIADELGITVIPLKYGYFDLVRFLCPFGFCRRGPITRLQRQLQGIREDYRDCSLVVFAHSFGTYALSQILLANPRFTFDRIILCGSIIPYDFDWDRVQNQIVTSGEKRDAIINECGIRDVWPVLAQSITWGYGSTGTFGFGVQNVRDRFHPSGHSAFFDKDFVRDYWLPAAAGLPFDFSPTDRSDATSPRWFTFLRLPLRWAIAAGIVLLLGAGSLELVSASQNDWCGRGTVRVDASCRNAADLKSKKELAARISTLLEDTKRVLDLKGGTLFPMMRDYDGNQQAWDEIRQVATGLLQRVSDGLAHVQDYDAFIWQEGDKTILVTKEERIAIDTKYWNAFKGVKGHFDGRASILKQMLRSTSPPSRDQMEDWRRELEDLHGKLEGAAVPLLQLLS